MTRPEMATAMPPRSGLDHARIWGILRERRATGCVLPRGSCDNTRPASHERGKFPARARAGSGRAGPSGSNRPGGVEAGMFQTARTV
jgi:hypothetical protein